MRLGRNPRRAYTSDGREITPMDVANAREAGATGIWARCEACEHSTALPIARFDPRAYVPDLALRLRRSACGSRRVTTQPD